MNRPHGRRRRRGSSLLLRVVLIATLGLGALPAWSQLVVDPPAAQQLPGILEKPRFAAGEAERAVIEPNYHLNEDGNYEASLNGEWDFILDEDAHEAGLTRDWTIAAGAWPADKTHRLAVPGCFTAQIDGLRDFVGVGWYRVRVPITSIPPDMDMWAFVFDGVARDVHVHLNGLPAAQSQMSYVPFDFVQRKQDLAGRDYLDIALRVSNEIPQFGIPDREWDGWWNHAGIFRKVTMYGFPTQVSIGSAHVRSYLKDRAAGPAGGWMLAVIPLMFEGDSRFADSSKHTFEAKLTFAGEDFDPPSAEPVVFEASERLDWATRGVLFDLPGNLPAWSPGHPALGRLEMILRDPDGEIAARRIMSFGLREAWLSGSQVVFNGEPLRIFGFAYHELYPGRGFALSDDQIREDLTRMKELGANMVRSAHYPPNPIVPALCDELGLFLWSEIPAWKTSAESLEMRRTRQWWAPRYLVGMIWRDLANPSVLFWSVGNEFDTRDKRVRRFVEEAIEFVRDTDSSRLVTFASDKREDDTAFDLVDVIAINEYYGWYYGEIDEVGPMLDRLAALHPDKPILVSEFGAGAVFGQKERAPGARRDYSEPAQVDFLRRHIAQIYDPKRAGFMVGGCMWLWADFEDPHRTEKHHPVEWHYMNLKGVVTGDRRPKESYEMLRELLPTLDLTR